MSMTGSSVERLALHAEILALIEVRRQETGASLLGESIAQHIVNCQFSEIESDILENPGAIEPWLVRRRSR